MTIRKLRNYYNGQWVDQESNSKFLAVFNPSTGDILAHVPMTKEQEITEAINAGVAAFGSWSSLPTGKRMTYLFKLREALVAQKEGLAVAIAQDQGKHISDARSEVERAIQLTETACAIPFLMRGDKIAISAEIDGEIRREPLGVVGALAPFNFPALVFGWFVPFAIGCGNTMVYKASEQSPLFMQMIAQILDDIQLPKGVFNLVNGDQTVGEALLNSPQIQAMAFVGSTKVGQIVADGCAKTGKKAMILAGAKNTLIVAEDANITGFIPDFLNACYGAAGQRCMSGANVVVVDSIYDQVKASIVEASKQVKIGDACDDRVFMGPVISKEALTRIQGMIDLGLEEGCTLVLDGRAPTLAAHNKEGYFIGPTILEGATAQMRVVKEEIFGPVVTLIKASCFTEGIQLINDSIYGNGGTIFTESGLTAQRFLRDTNSGMLGVNVGVPAAMPYLPFGGTKGSLLGSQIKAQGLDSVEFFTKRKVATIRYYGKEAPIMKEESSCCFTR